MKASGVRFLVGKSFALIFARNCLNLGLQVVTCPAAVEATGEDSQLVLDLDAGTLEVGGTAFAVPPPPAFMREMLAAGGLVEWVRGRVAATRKSPARP